MTSRPQFAYARYSRTDEFEGSQWAGARIEQRGIQYYQSEAGARFAAVLCGEWDDPESYGQVLKLQPGVVYDHDANRWVDGLAYQPWYGERRLLQPVDDWDDVVPF